MTQLLALDRIPTVEEKKKSYSSGERIYKELDIETKQLDEYTFDFLISGEKVDRIGDVIHQDGMDTTRYLNPDPKKQKKSNNVILQFHMHDRPAVGNTIKLTKHKNGTTTARAKFTDITEDGRMFAALYAAGVMKAVSVGIIIKDFYIDKDDVFHITASELVEFSVVNVPMYPDALAKSIKDGSVNKFALMKQLERAKKSLEMLTKDVVSSTMSGMEVEKLIEAQKGVQESNEKILEGLKALQEAVEKNTEQVKALAEKSEQESSKKSEDDEELSAEEQEKIYNEAKEEAEAELNE